LVSACGGGSGGSSSGAAGGGNSAPLITSGNTYSVAEGATSIGTVSASDVDGDNLTFSLSGADAGVISIGSTSGALSFNSPADFENPADDGGDNVYNVTARVGDGSAFDARDLVITVTNNNDAPVISSGGSYSVTENVTVIGSVDATDADGDTLTYSLSGDDASLMTVSSTGALSFVSAPDFETPGDADANNIYEAIVTVTDGTAQATQAVNVTVTDLEEAVNATELFISEYSEGSSNNKYIEIFNGTGASVSLDGYAWPTNAAPSAEEGKHEYWNTFTEGAVIANNDVYVVCNGSLDASVSAACDQTGSVFFNGDDGVALAKGTEESFTVVDVVGTWSATDPGAGYEVCGVADGTLNHTLIKKEKVEGNAGDWTSSAGTSAEDCDWIVKDENYWSDIGLHCWDSEYAADSIVINNASGALSVAENGTSVATVSTTVSACGSVAFSLTGDDKDLFTVSETGVVEFVSAPDYENPADTGADNVYNFTVVATNGSASDSLAMVVTVTDVNEDIPTYSGQVYISEYAEGSSNNKYLEIFNGTDGTINLDDYAMANANNGADVAGTYDYWNAFTAGATLGKGQAWVVCHPSADDVIKAECDQEHPYLSNGDDGYAVVQGTEESYTVLDLVGDWSAEDPGDGWEVCGVADGTKDHTLVKKSDKYGTADWAVSAGTNAEDCYWEVKAVDVWDGVGAHTETEPVSTALTLTVSADGSAVRMTGPWWGWDPAGGPEAVANGDGTFTVTLDPAPTESMEYLWVVDGVQENLVAAAAAGECSAEIDAGAFVTDYSGYANRKHVLGSGNVTDDVYGACDGTPASATGIVADMSGIFDGFTYDEATSTYSWPSTAQDWAGVANENAALYPISFTEAGKITFKASAPNGDVVVRFRFEANPYPNTEPSYNTTSVTVTGAAEADYEIDVPAQGDLTFNSFLMYLDTRDVAVIIPEVRVVADEKTEPVGNGGGVAVFDDPFAGGGFVYDADTSTYTFPTGAEEWAGVANSNTDMYPMKFPNGGTLSVTASASTATNINLLWEANPYPNNTPSFRSDNILVSGAEQTYTWTIPSQGEQTFNAFNFYIVERDQPVVLTNVTVTPNE
jgi:hypothetical protein